MPRPVGAAAAISLCGVSIAFQSGFLAEIIDIGDIGVARAAFEATTNTSPGGAGEMLPACFPMMKPFTCTLAFDPNQDIEALIKAAPETITITWPEASGYDGNATWAFTGFATDYSGTGNLKDRMTARVTITCSGLPTVTAVDPV